MEGDGGTLAALADKESVHGLNKDGRQLGDIVPYVMSAGSWAQGYMTQAPLSSPPPCPHPLTSYTSRPP